MAVCTNISFLKNCRIVLLCVAGMARDQQNKNPPEVNGSDSEVYQLYHDEVMICFVCLCIQHQSCLNISAGTVNCAILGGLGSSVHLLWSELHGVFNVPEGDSPQNMEPPFIA